jgi:hypothetical protein
MKTLLAATALALAVTLSSAPANALSIRVPFLGISVHLPIAGPHYYRRVVRRPVYARSAPVRTRTAAPVRTRQHSTTTASNGGMSINDPK